MIIVIGYSQYSSTDDDDYAEMYKTIGTCFVGIIAGHVEMGRIIRIIHDINGFAKLDFFEDSGSVLILQMLGFSVDIKFHYRNVGGNPSPSTV